jgi:hypothetical protein
MSKFYQVPSSKGWFTAAAGQLSKIGESLLNQTADFA